MGPFDLKKFIIENRAAVKEMASTGKLESNEDYQFMIQQLKGIIKDEEQFKQVIKIVDSIGELGLDLGYAEAVNDVSVTKEFN